MKTAVHKPSFSFSRNYRLTTKADYAAVFDKQEQLKVSLAWFLVLYKKNQKSHPRMGIIVSKRILKKAPSRNYLKRVLREGFRAHQAKMQNLDLVIMTRKGCKTEDKVKLRKELDTLWQRLLTL